RRQAQPVRRRCGASALHPRAHRAGRRRRQSESLGANMPDLPKIIRSLEQVATGYTVFEPNQVLSDTQLNGLTSYLDDQDRLTRVELLGVGIVGGLRVRLDGNRVRVGHGVGVPTDGDLLLLADDA